MKLFISSIFIAFTLSNACAYSNNIDLIETDSINDLAWEKMDSNPDLSRKLANDIHHIYSSINYKRGLIKTYYLKGYIEQTHDYYDRAAQYYFEGLNILNNYNGPNGPLYEMLFLQNLGNVFEYTYSLGTALNYYQKALTIAELSSFPDHQSVLNYNIGIVLDKMQKYEKAKLHFVKALNLTDAKASNFNLLSSIYNALGNVNSTAGDYNEAKIYYLKAVHYQELIGNSTDLAFYISNLGENLFKQEQFIEAINYYQKALKISENHNDFRKMKWLYSNLGDAYFALKNYQKAIEQFEESIALGNPEIYDPEYQRAIRNIIKAYQQIGEYKKALHYQELQTQAKLLEQKSQYKVKEVELVVENQSSKQKLDSFASEKSRFITIIIGIFMSLNCLLLIAFAYYKGRPFLKKVFSSKP